MTPLTLLAIVLLVGSFVGTSNALESQSSATRAAALSELLVDDFYEPYLSIAREIPQFAGAYVDPKTQRTLVVLATDGSPATAERVRSAFLALGSPYEAYDDYELEVVHADYSFAELHQWLPALRAMLGHPWVTSAGIDVTANRLTLVVTDLDTYRQSAEREFSEREIPREMVTLGEGAGAQTLLPSPYFSPAAIAILAAAALGVAVLIALMVRRPGVGVCRWG